MMSVVRMDGGGDRGYTGYWAAQSSGCWAGTRDHLAITLLSPCHHLCAGGGARQGGADPGSQHSAVSSQSFCAGLSVSQALAAGNMCPVSLTERQSQDSRSGDCWEGRLHQQAEVQSHKLQWPQDGCHGVKILLITAVRVWGAAGCSHCSAPPPPPPRPGLQGYTVIHYWIALHCAER